jgi:hypothetical protein
VIIDHFDGMGVVVDPTKADAPLAIDADAVLAGAIASERFQPVPRRSTQIVEAYCGIQHEQLDPSPLLQGTRPSSRSTSVEHRFSVLASKRDDHRSPFETIVQMHPANCFDSGP